MDAVNGTGTVHHQSSPSLGVTGVTIAHGTRVVVRDVSFSAAPGTLVWITGDNGAGKSSLLRALAGRGNASGHVTRPSGHDLRNVCFYSPLMGVPTATTVRRWIEFNHRIQHGDTVVLAETDPLVPAVQPNALLTSLSTGEAKRLLLWGLLRVKRDFTFLDEPYEHLSPPAKHRLTEILLERSEHSVVVVATNQDVPDTEHKLVLEIA